MRRRDVISHARPPSLTSTCRALSDASSSSDAADAMLRRSSRGLSFLLAPSGLAEIARMSAFGGKADSKCSRRAFPLLTLSRHRRKIGLHELGGKSSSARA